MKQHITTDQINELSEKGKNKYYEWCKKNNIYTFPSGVRIKDEFLSLLLIGQMIEFLDEKNAYTENYLNAPKESCDRLWDAVKTILEK